MLDFSKLPQETLDLAEAIAERAVDKGYADDMTEAVMDISGMAMADPSMKLEKLLKADPVTFAHDFHGIRQHINRKTGELENCFVPRFTRQVV